MTQNEKEHNLLKSKILVKDIKTLLFAFTFCELSSDVNLGEEEIEAIERLQKFIDEDIIDLKKLKEC